MIEVLRIAVLALATSAISVTVTLSTLFGPFRAWVPGEFLRELVRCPYCFSHWVAFGLLLLHRPVNYTGARFWLVSWFVEWFAVVAVAAIISFTIKRLGFTV